VLRPAGIPALKLQQRRDHTSDFIGSVGHCPDHLRLQVAPACIDRNSDCSTIVRSWSDHSRLNSKSGLIERQKCSSGLRMQKLLGIVTRDKPIIERAQRRAFSAAAIHHIKAAG
jgi:hypothetical protein